MSDYGIEVHTAEVPGTPLLLLVVSEVGVSLEPLPALDDLPIDTWREFLNSAAVALRECATHLDAHAAGMSDWPHPDVG
jgi:hypothetical protein